MRGWSPAKWKLFVSGERTADGLGVAAIRTCSAHAGIIGIVVRLAASTLDASDAEDGSVHHQDQQGEQQDGSGHDGQSGSGVWSQSEEEEVRSVPSGQLSVVRMQFILSTASKTSHSHSNWPEI